MMAYKVLARLPAKAAYGAIMKGSRQEALEFMETAAGVMARVFRED